jgi:hypothetical protein
LVAATVGPVPRAAAVTLASSCARLAQKAAGHQAGAGPGGVTTARRPTRPRQASISPRLLAGSALTSSPGSLWSLLGCLPSCCRSPAPAPCRPPPRFVCRSSFLRSLRGMFPRDEAPPSAPKSSFVSLAGSLGPPHDGPPLPPRLPPRPLPRFMNWF